MNVDECLKCKLITTLTIAIDCLLAICRWLLIFGLS